MFSCFTAHLSMWHVTLTQVSCAHVIHVSSAWCCCLEYFSILHSALFTVSLIFLVILLIFIFVFHVGWFGEKYSVHFREWRVRPSGQQRPLSQVMSSTSSTTTRSQRPLKFFDPGTRPSNLHDLEIDDYTIGRALLFTVVHSGARNNQRAVRQAYLFPEESLLSSQSLSVGHVRPGRPVSDEFGSLISNVQEKSTSRHSAATRPEHRGLEIVYGKWLDDANGTTEDPDAVRSRLVATQVNTHAREDVTQATPPIKASRIIVRQAAMKANAKGQHDCLIARHDIRVAF